jgi:hypothetical protein
MAQNRMTYQALLDQLLGADTDVLRRVLEHAMQLPRARGIRWSSARLCQPTMRRTRPMPRGGRPPANRDSE